MKTFLKIHENRNYHIPKLTGTIKEVQEGILCTSMPASQNNREMGTNQTPNW